MFTYINTLFNYLKVFWVSKPEPTKKIKVLFITKSKNLYNTTTPITLSTGLFNSANHIITGLSNEPWIEAKLVAVVDNNSIDREVTLFRPDIVIIEAVWVVPEKFTILKKLHPNVSWIIRIHSELPFIAGEGIALDWISQYLQQEDIYIATNSKNMLDDLYTIYPTSCDKISYLPNIYPCNSLPVIKKKPKNILKIGCFGAIRLLKNHLTQAVAAINYADQQKLNLEFHINASRIEGFSSENVLKNLRALFAARPEHKLVEHEWLSQEEFNTVILTLDLGMQVSFSETFNLVAADMISNGIPVVGSSELYWLADTAKVNTISSVKSIVTTLTDVNNNRRYNAECSFNKLKLNSNTYKQTWKDVLLKIS